MLTFGVATASCWSALKLRMSSRQKLRWDRRLACRLMTGKMPVPPKLPAAQCLGFFRMRWSRVPQEHRPTGRGIEVFFTTDAVHCAHRILRKYGCHPGAFVGATGGRPDAGAIPRLAGSLHEKALQVSR